MILQLVWVAIMVLWVVWFVNSDEVIQQLNSTFANANIDRSFGLGLLIAGCILLGVVLVGTIFLFVYYQRQRSLNKQQRNFVSSVTHELRSPLASLQLAFETMGMRELSPEVTAKLHHNVQTDLDRLRRLVDQILLSAKLDGGLIDLKKKEHINLLEFLKDIVEKTKHLDPALDGRVTVKCDPDLDLYSAPEGLSLIVTNLLENAVKYSAPESPIEITANRDSDTIELAISDHGLGLSPREKKRVFRLFHRADAATTRAIPGTGLGLFIVKTLVQNLGGSVRAESPGRGQGSTFMVDLPSKLID